MSRLLARRVSAGGCVTQRSAGLARASGLKQRWLSLLPTSCGKSGARPEIPVNSVGVAFPGSSQVPISCPAGLEMSCPAHLQGPPSVHPNPASAPSPDSSDSTLKGQWVFRRPLLRLKEHGDGVHTAQHSGRFQARGRPRCHTCPRGRRSRRPSLLPPSLPRLASARSRCCCCCWWWWWSPPTPSCSFLSP